MLRLVKPSSIFTFLVVSIVNSGRLLLLRTCETPITIEKLHEKLLAHEGYLRREDLKQNNNSIIANMATKQNLNKWNNYNTYKQSRFYNTSGNNNIKQGQKPNRNFNPKPYKGYCLLCDEQGHTTKRCLMFRVSPLSLQLQS